MAGQFRSKGYWEQQDRYSGKLLTGETYTCCHCGNLHEMTFKVEGGRSVIEVPAMCHKCWLPVCPKCHRKGTCTPFEKRMTEFERRMKEREARDRMVEFIGA